MKIHNGISEITSNIFKDNSASSGGSLFHDCDLNSISCEVSITSNTFSSNTATNDGGAIKFESVQPVESLNT